MITCKECIHWNVDEPIDEKCDYEYYKSCKLDDNKFLCDPIESEYSKDSLIYCDYEGHYGAWIKTGPDFGCIHGKKRD